MCDTVFADIRSFDYKKGQLAGRVVRDQHGLGDGLEAVGLFEAFVFLEELRAAVYALCVVEETH